MPGKRSVFVIAAEDGRVVVRGDIPTTPEGFRQLRRQHELAAETPVARETGTVAFHAARELARVGLRPVVIAAHEVRVKAHRPRQKSDRRDTFALCEELRRGQSRSIIHVPRAPLGALRETLLRRRHSCPRWMGVALLLDTASGPRSRVQGGEAITRRGYLAQVYAAGHPTRRRQARGRAHPGGDAGGAARGRAAFRRRGAVLSQSD